MDELLDDFIAETRETLAALAEEIVLWEADPGDRERLDAIFRFVHTVKGSCGFLNLARLERLSHAAEDVLAEVRDGHRVADGRLVDAVLAIIDRIGDIVEAMDLGQGVPSEDDEDLIAALAAGAAPALPVENAVLAVPRAPARSIRLPLSLLDRMMNGVSNLVLTRNELARRLRDEGLGGEILAAFNRMSSSIAEVRDAITRTRTARIDALFGMLPRMVRDLSGDLDKQVRLEGEGGAPELDRELIEVVRDPLSHIVRNAIDHGIEPADVRVGAGKPAAAMLRVAARQTGNRITIEVSDDGRGIDPDRIAARAITTGRMTAAEVARMSHAHKLDLVFLPGLSTAEAVTEISGRGVGMDVVRANLGRIGGSVMVESQLGRGTRVTLRVPMTLTIIPALVISCRGQRFAIPRGAIDEIVRIGSDRARLETIGDALFVVVHGQRLPMVSLDGLLGGTQPGDATGYLILLRALGGSGDLLYALAVDDVHDHDEIVVRPAAPQIMEIGLYGGITLPDDGRPMLLLDPGAIAARAEVVRDVSAPVAPSVEAEPVATMQVLLFRALDGVERAVRLTLVERIEDVPASAVSFSAGRWRAMIGGALLPLIGCDMPPVQAALRVLRLSDGSAELAVAIDAIVDITNLIGEVGPAAAPGPIAGVAILAGRPVELIDVHWLFAEEARNSRPTGRRPRCLLHGDDAWVREILRPLLDAAGYATLFEPGEDGPPDLIIDAAAGGAPAVSAQAAPIIRLRSTPDRQAADDDSIFRYDRVELFAAIERKLAGGGR
jgi:two-component system chemotaxis sensor kinase CheA